jgi:antitoxin HicB
MRFTIVLLPEEEGGYTALVPALGSIASQGETVAEALANVQEAITGYPEAITPQEVPLVCADGEPDGTVVSLVEVLPGPGHPAEQLLEAAPEGLGVADSPRAHAEHRCLRAAVLALHRGLHRPGAVGRGR